MVHRWVDKLDLDASRIDEGCSPDSITTNGTKSLLVAQYLPNITLPTFCGSILNWTEFFMKFKDVVHNQEYLSNARRH